jgi:hypothetical protein
MSTLNDGAGRRKRRIDILEKKRGGGQVEEELRTERTSAQKAAES